MNNIKAIIVDDEPATRQKLERYLNEVEGFEVCAICENGEQAIKNIIETQPHVVFIDIEMPEINGFEVVNSVSEMENIYWIFVTAYDQYAIKAFEVDALDYLLKPFDKRRFFKTIARAKKYIDSQLIEENSKVTGSEKNYLSKLLVKDSDSYILIDIDHIKYFESSGNYIKIFVKENKYLIRSTLKYLETKLDPDTFVRIHKSYIVNIDFIKGFEQWFSGDYEVELKDGKKLKLSRNYKEVFDRFK